MDKYEQRIKIAEACGWKIQKVKIDEIHVWEPGSQLPMRLGLNLERVIPDYPRDLNAMHEAEKILKNDEPYSQRNFYASILGSLTYNDNGRGWQPLSNDDCFPITHATAAQRAEAFLKTLNLWK